MVRFFLCGPQHPYPASDGGRMGEATGRVRAGKYRRGSGHPESARQRAGGVLSAVHHSKRQTHLPGVRLEGRVSCG